MKKFDLEKEIKDNIDKYYDGDSEKYLDQMKRKVIFFLSMGGLTAFLACVLYHGGRFPLFTGICSIVFLGIGMLGHNMYNKSRKILEKDE